ADPGRRSGMMALWAALRMILRRPVRALTVGALGAGVGLGIAAVLMALRLQIARAEWRRWRLPGCSLRERTLQSAGAGRCASSALPTWPTPTRRIGRDPKASGWS